MNRPDILFPCLDSLRDGNEEHILETLVVAYQFTSENMVALVEKYPWVTIVPSDGIRGFSENNNLALKHVKGRYCFILNDDTIVPPHALDRLVQDLRTLPENAAAITPAIRFADGSLQTCGRNPWTRWRYFKHYLHLVDEGAKRPESLGVVTPPSSLFQTYTLNGACFLIKTEAFKNAGWFDERYFFTPEDIALGHKLNDMGYTVWADPSVSITHLAGKSVSAMEQAIKPARVRGSMIFYGEPFALKLFIWCFEALRYVKHTLFTGNHIMRQTALNVMRTVFSKLSPKEIFIRFRP